MKIYFDNAATTQVDHNVLLEIHNTNKNFWGNPSSAHPLGIQAKEKILQCRADIARCCGCEPEEIIFTSGGSEADNMALRQSVKDLKIENIISSKIEHKAVLDTVTSLSAEGTTFHPVHLNEFGHVDLDSLEDLLKKNRNSLVSLMAVNNEIGNILDIEAVSKLCQEYGALFHSDTVQLMGHSKIDFTAMGVDFAACSAHKFHGPKGVGFMFKKKDIIKIKPMITGGGQEMGFRAGTENIGGIAGMTAALVFTDNNRENDHSHIYSIKQEFVRSIREEFPEVAFNGDVDGRSSSTIVNFALPLNPDPDQVDLVTYLSNNGICASRGSACSGSKVSYVVTELKRNLNKENVRVSFGRNNTVSEVEMMMELLLDFYSVKK